MQEVSEYGGVHGLVYSLSVREALDHVACQAHFRPDEVGIQCVNERKEFTIYVAVMLSGAFEMSAMLVLSAVHYLLPLSLGLYLSAVMVFTIAAHCHFEPQLHDKICTSSRHQVRLLSLVLPVS